MDERRSGEDRRKPGRPKQFDGPPVSVRMPAPLYDDLAREALRRSVDVSEVIRERLLRSPKIDKPAA